MYKIFEDLYELEDGTYLKYNQLSKSWKNVSNISHDILTQDLPDVIVKIKKVISNIADKHETIYSMSNGGNRETENLEEIQTRLFKVLDNLQK